MAVGSVFRIAFATAAAAVSGVLASMLWFALSGVVVAPFAHMPYSAGPLKLADLLFNPITLVLFLDALGAALATQFFGRWAMLLAAVVWIFPWAWWATTMLFSFPPFFCEWYLTLPVVSWLAGCLAYYWLNRRLGGPTPLVERLRH